MQDQMQRGRERSLQKQDETKRKKADKLSNMKPGAKRAIAQGLATKQSPIDVMREEYSRRKYNREQKKK